MGRLAREKNFPLFIEVARRVGAGRADCRFLIAGDGPERDALKAALASAPVHLVGRVDDRPKFFAALDAFLLTSDHEALPAVIVEAMASGLPIVASRLDGLVATLREGESALFAPPGDAGAFVRAISVLRDGPGVRARLGAAARDRAVGRHDARAMAAAVGDLHAELHGVACFRRGDKTAGA